MSNIKSTENAKKAILDKIAEKLAKETKETIRANHSAHYSTHSSHGSRNIH